MHFPRVLRPPYSTYRPTNVPLPAYRAFPRRPPSSLPPPRCPAFRAGPGPPSRSPDAAGVPSLHTVRGHPDVDRPRGAVALRGSVRRPSAVCLAPVPRSVPCLPCACGQARPSPPPPDNPYAQYAQAMGRPQQQQQRGSSPDAEAASPTGRQQQQQQQQGGSGGEP